MKLAVIADDLTGANACGALFTEDGFQVETKFYWSNHDKQNSSIDVALIDTNSRQNEPREAKERLTKIIHRYRSMGVSLFSNRIDSTMRGNIGAEAEEWLKIFGEDAVIVIVPSFPDSGRTVVDGDLYVHGQFMHHTSVGKDPTTPMEDSKVENLVNIQTDLKTAQIALRHVDKGPLHLAYHFKRLADEGQRIFIVDAITNAHIKCIAEAMRHSERSMYPFDPGPLTFHYMRSQLKLKSVSRRKTLICIGSANEVIEMQMNKFSEARNITPIVIDPQLFLQAMKKEDCFNIVEQIVKAFSSQHVVITTTVVPGKRRLSLKEYAIKNNLTVEEVAMKITNGYAALIYNVLIKEVTIQGCFTSGGDFTAALCKKSGAEGLRLIKQIAPLTAYGKLNGGELHGMKLITKGGSVGDLDIIEQCTKQLESSNEDTVEEVL